MNIPAIKYVQLSGDTHEIDVPVGDSVMQGAVNNLIDGIVAECGGACAVQLAIVSLTMHGLKELVRHAPMRM